MLNGIGLVLFCVGTIDGHPMTAAFLVVGSLLLLPGTCLAFLIGHPLGRVIVDDTVASFLAGLVAVAINAGLWLIIAAVLNSRKQREVSR